MRKSWTLSLVVLVVFVSACSPATTPPPAQAPRPSASAAPSSDVATVPRVSPEDTTWAKVEEAAKKENRLVIYGATPFANAGREINAAFTARYGIPVDLLLLSGRQQVEKLKVERAMRNPIADVVQTGIASATEIIFSGLGEKTADTLPALRDKSVYYFDPVYGNHQQIISFSFQVLGPAINTKLVKPDEIKSWNDMLNPKWKGRIAMSDPRGTGTGLNLFSTLTYFKVLDYDYFRRLAQQQPTLLAESNRESYLKLARGEYDLDFGAGQNSIAPLIVEGAPLKVLAMEEGNTAQVEGLLLGKDAPHPNAARLFINWLLSMEGQEAYNKTVGAKPLRKDMPDFTPEKVKVNPKKIWNRTWEAAEQSNIDLKSGITEQIFGKK